MANLVRVRFIEHRFALDLPIGAVNRAIYQGASLQRPTPLWHTFGLRFASTVPLLLVLWAAPASAGQVGARDLTSGDAI